MGALCQRNFYAITVSDTAAPTPSMNKLLIVQLINALLVFLWSIIKSCKKAKCNLIIKKCVVLVSLSEMLCFLHVEETISTQLSFIRHIPSPQPTK